jgi:hypothetical protein
MTFRRSIQQVATVSPVLLCAPAHAVVRLVVEAVAADGVVSGRGSPTLSDLSWSDCILDNISAELSPRLDAGSAVVETGTVSLWSGLSGPIPYLIGSKLRQSQTEPLGQEQKVSPALTWNWSRARAELAA